jgi:voltage-gated potassium channel
MQSKLRRRIHEVVFEADTPSGKFFDIFLLVAIVLSVIVVMLESVSNIAENHKTILIYLEWTFTIIFTLEYILRIYSIGKPLKYMFSFYGIIDLLSTIPTYLSFFFVGSHGLLILRTLRLMRVFRVLKLTRFVGESNNLRDAMKNSWPKIAVFLAFIFGVVMIMGTLMYLIEGGENGFTSIPVSVYWAIVTLTTVGFGDIAPHTPLGQAVASIIMIMGYGIIAVPTGIVSAEMTQIGKVEKQPTPTNTQACKSCSREGHADDAEFCKFCGEKL